MLFIYDGGFVLGGFCPRGVLSYTRKSVVLDLYQKVSRLIRKEMNRKRATDRNLSPICCLRLPFILYPNITSVHNMMSQYYQELKGCESGGV